MCIDPTRPLTCSGVPKSFNVAELFEMSLYKGEMTRVADPSSEDSHKDSYHGSSQRGIQKFPLKIFNIVPSLHDGGSSNEYSDGEG